MQRIDLQQDSWDRYLRGAFNSVGDYGEQGYQSHSVAFRGSAELGRVWVLLAIDIMCRSTLTSWILSRLAVYMEYGIRFPLTGGELHYVSRVLWSNMNVSALSQTDIGMDLTCRLDVERLLLPLC